MFRVLLFVRIADSNDPRGGQNEVPESAPVTVLLHQIHRETAVLVVVRHFAPRTTDCDHFLNYLQYTSNKH